MSALEYYTEPLSIMSFILEDEKYDAEVIEKMFQENDFGEYRRFDRGSAVIKALADQRVHLFIADFKGIDLDGIEVMKEVKKQNPRCYFIFMTIYVTNRITERAVNEIGIKKYVDKNRKDCFDVLEEFVIEGIASIKEDFDFIKRLSGRIDRLNPKETK